MLDLKTHYWPRYCEENVWHLCRQLPQEITDARVLFVSNPERSVAIWHQRACTSAHKPVVWDYHVVLLGWAGATWQIWDADSSLVSPVAAALYLEASFRELAPEQAELGPRFRVVEAGDYRRELCSDRSHMRSADGGWHSPPPLCEPIGIGTNLMRFVDTQADFLGWVCDLPALRAWLAEPMARARG